MFEWAGHLSDSGLAAYTSGVSACYLQLSLLGHLPWHWVMTWVITGPLLRANVWMGRTPQWLRVTCQYQWC